MILTAFEKLEKYLSKHSLKMTVQRKVILDILSSLEHHVSLEELFQEVQKQQKGIGTATLYRTMKLFSNAKIANELRFEDGLTRYELATGDHHDHIICLECRRIIEFEDEIIEQRQEDIAKKNGILILSHKLELYGRCIDTKGCLERQSL
jgi:Fur family ferric uptake transcriptional regulator